MNLTRPELVELSRNLPAEWLSSSSAVGTAAVCAARLHEYIDAGADEVVLHGTTAEHLGSLPARFAAPANRGEFDERKPTGIERRSCSLA